MTKRVTINDVAKLAGVSVATVSAVINKNKYVSPELKQRVELTIDKLGYRPNLVARSLKMQETKTIGLIFTNITSPIWPPLVRIVQNLAQQAGFDTFLVTTDEDVEQEKMSFHNFLAKRVDGILIAPAFNNDYEHIREANLFVPIVSIERQVPGIEGVVTNNEAISYQAVKHLLNHGYQKVGLVTIPLQGSSTADRVAGYTRALQEHDCYDPTLIKEVDVIGDTAFNLALDLLKNTDTEAIFTTSQSTAIGTLQAAIQQGRRIPNDLGLFAYDDAPWMRVVSSPLSTVCQPIEAMGELAVKSLFECIEGREACDATHFLESSLIIRHSCGC